MHSLRRVRSQSSSTNTGPHLFSGFQQWRRRRPSASVPSSPSDTQAHSGSAIATASTSLAALQDHPEPNEAPSTDQECSHSTNDTQPPSLVTDPSSNPADGVPIRLVPNLGTNTRCFVFDVIDRVLEPNYKIKIGRYSERHVNSDRLSFKSKVVSRTHAEIWVDENKKVYLRDVGSSSGTFVNHVRQSPSNVASAPMELKDGDLIQLGVDYQGGWEQMYRAVKMRVEINRHQQPSQQFQRQAFQNLRHHLLGTTPPLSTTPTHPTSLVESTTSGDPALTAATAVEPSVAHSQPNLDTLRASMQSTNDFSLLAAQHRPTSIADIQECCICLYAIAPVQALFVTPCSHVYHFKCLRPIIFQHYPAFSCPLCRSYFDLEASVSVEVSEVAEALGLLSTQPKPSPSISTEQPGTSLQPLDDDSMQDAGDDDDHEGEDAEERTSSDQEELIASSSSIAPQPTPVKRTANGPDLHIRTGSNLDTSLLSTTLVETPTMDQPDLHHPSSPN
ncbi:SMAD/FHA domain-containing protein [Hesseltinella vesiculosa]|uniref:SMAD/FHA domain-containing protein n=1 Tax=Hesseltinella vesiculosa TaxID=101127 RepID=A0A1X2GS82_9FUNG|nr:SMAD/FHA domain-containing protein [Hesseltinella vesiculosa]